MEKSGIVHNDRISSILASLRMLCECFLGLRVNNQYVLPTIVIETTDLAATTIWCGYGLLGIMAIYSVH